ncbi:hypothetical protein SAMN05216215_10714 [Saccharopolyspora shandongensis]|uniref:Uncharacterized protein n=1 Tax=Saccharopolyspora shandongensis TaxID=418495 RepID=A0A1H3SX94_9PSEU|nr:nuclear transport factor 2 family protein [Saccharopolyspora shandongensis]SDZ41729.1 hypothetical protein SAMN05216215_10714 [Saccharopolyspora shandongensis]
MRETITTAVHDAGTVFSVPSISACASPRTLIYEVQCRYCRGIDRLDLELVRSCYHPGAVDHHVSFDGDRDQFIAWLDVELRKAAGSIRASWMA